MMDYEIRQLDSQTWSVENRGVRFFLLTGTKKALLIDSGMTTENGRKIAESLTDLPLQLITTHADVDHIAGNDSFETVLMHPCRWSRISSPISWRVRIRSCQVMHLSGQARSFVCQ